MGLGVETMEQVVLERLARRIFTRKPPSKSAVVKVAILETPSDDALVIAVEGGIVRLEHREDAPQHRGLLAQRF
jgi:hypothetical protein